MRTRTASTSAPPGTPLALTSALEFSTEAWHAVFTNTRHEKKVAHYCQLRGVEQFLPTYCSRRTWKNRQSVNLDVPLFPNYLFVRILPAQRSAVLGIPGVISLVGRVRGYSTVPEPYIEMLRTGTALQRIFPHPTTEVGDQVRIVSGPMAGIEGILVRARSDLRVVVSIELIHQNIAIEIARDEIEPVRNSAPCIAGSYVRTES